MNKILKIKEKKLTGWIFALLKRRLRIGAGTALKLPLEHGPTHSEFPLPLTSIMEGIDAYGKGNFDWKIVDSCAILQKILHVSPEITLFIWEVMFA